MRGLLVLPLILALAGCDRRQVREADAPASTPPKLAVAPAVVDDLVAHPLILADVHRRCKARAPDAPPELCAAAAEATRRRFMAPSAGYAPAPVHPFAGGN